MYFESAEFDAFCDGAGEPERGMCTRGDNARALVADLAVAFSVDQTQVGILINRLL